MSIRHEPERSAIKSLSKRRVRNRGILKETELKTEESEQKDKGASAGEDSTGVDNTDTDTQRQTDIFVYVREKV